MEIKRQHLILRVVAGVLALALVGLAVDRCLRRITVQEERQVEQTLLEVGEQNAARLQAVLDNRNMLLSALCVQMSDEADPNYLIDQFRVLVDVYQAEYIGFADTEGKGYTTLGVTVDLSDWDTLSLCLRGQNVLTDVRRDSLSGSGKNINLYFAPVYRIYTGQTMGVMFIAYRTDAFSRLLEVSSFDGQGTGCIFQKDGTLVAASQGGALEPGGNIFEDLTALSRENAEAVARLQSYVKGRAQDPVMLTASDGTAERYFHVMELAGRPGWYLATVVPTAVLDQRMEPMLDSVRRMIAVVTVLVALCAVVYLWTYHSQRKELHRLAYQDPITGGDNYAAFCRKMTAGKRVSGAGYVISADLRDFDSVNETCGMQRGNEVLRAMHRVFTAHLEKGELCARVAADRFLLFLHADGEDALVERLKVLRDEIAAISPQQGIPQIMSKFGVRAVESPGQVHSAYRDVNLALRRLSERVDYFYAIYNEEDKSRAGETHDMETRFEKAISQHRFEMWFQPKYAPATGHMVAAEALVRWRRPDGKLVPPGKFIPLFERNGMIAQLDEYTLNAVCAQQKFWLDRGYAVVPVSVNLSRVSLMFPDIAQRLADIVQSHDLPVEYVELEITESAMEGRANLDEVIARFRARGFRIQMDDFGSGYSSLSTLTKRCFDNVKIDKSLVDCIGDHQGDALIESIVRLVHDLGMTVTAEGVEQEEQMRFLRDLGVDNIQGYYYSRPLPSGDFEKLLSPREG